MEKTYDVIVVGAGASGLMAAASAAGGGASCIVLEQKKRPGSKMLITGKGRCNITNDCEIDQLFENVRRNRRFLYSALYSFTNDDIIRHFNSLGVLTKVERGGRVFPITDKASDAVDALAADAVKKGARILTGIRASQLIIENGVIAGVECSDKTVFHGRNVILACGGKSYPSTGSDGSGYLLAKEAGHNIITPRGSLTGLETSQEWVAGASGLTLKNVGLGIRKNGKKIFYMQGELLLTHFGISGPITLTASAYLADAGFSDAQASIDLKPALDTDKLDARILRDFTQSSNKQFSNSLGALLPSSLIAPIVIMSGIDPVKKCNQITAAERKGLAALLKDIRLDITGPRPLEEAIVTAGGVDVSEINPSTLESNLVKGLYFCGEIIDVDANTGGYNLTIAFSTGRLAGLSASKAR
ncbi:MAG: NAD(P)/FAD-dependent oxidoreductase [Clostridia bacterium]|nr:NAD(P)/FAD-dependent oxidoreductase [Clostridia bacterium]